MDFFIIKEIRISAQKRILFTLHALEQMNMPERMISEKEVKEVIKQEEIIEDYPDDKRGHSCLMVGKTSTGRILHVVCAPKPTHLVIITAYLPDLGEWIDNFRKRR